MYAFEKLLLSKNEVDMLFKSFTSADYGNSGYVTTSDICNHYKIEKNGLICRMLSTFEVERTGKLNFLEYVCSIWNFLSCRPGILGSFAFQSFDISGSNSMDGREVKAFVELIHNKTYEKHIALQKLIDKLKQISPKIGIVQFNEFCKLNPSLCQPLLVTQEMIQKQIIGGPFWKTLVDRRSKFAEMNNIGFIATLHQDVVLQYELLASRQQIDNKHKEFSASTERILSRKDSFKKQNSSGAIDSKKKTQSESDDTDCKAGNMQQSQAIDAPTTLSKSKLTRQGTNSKTLDTVCDDSGSKSMEKAASWDAVEGGARPDSMTKKQYSRRSFEDDAHHSGKEMRKKSMQKAYTTSDIDANEEAPTGISQIPSGLQRTSSSRNVKSKSSKQRSFDYKDDHESSDGNDVMDLQRSSSKSNLTSRGSNGEMKKPAQLEPLVVSDKEKKKSSSKSKSRVKSPKVQPT